jgi:hypothetical protein
VKAHVVGFCLGLSLAACASAFPYKYFGVGSDAAGELRGTILAKEPKDDRPLSDCAPDDQSKGKCVLMFIDEWEKLRAERVELIERLKACEGGS